MLPRGGGGQVGRGGALARLRRILLCSAAMLDIKLLRDDSGRIAQNLADRHARVSLPGLQAEAGPDAMTEALVGLDRNYLELLKQSDELRRAQNETSAAMKGVAKLAKEAQ